MVARSLLLATLLLAAACPRHSPSSVSAPIGNAVQVEMQLLTVALESAVRGVGVGDVRPVEHALHQVHAAREATAAALASGSYRPKRNADRLADFEALDTAFHAHLESLVTASRANDVPRTVEALGAALNACQGCHGQFR